MTTTMVRNATVITVDPNRRIIEDGAVVVEDDRIAAVGATDDLAAEWTPDEVVEGRGRVVIPGLVDLYSHSGCGIFKPLGDQLAGVGWWDLMDDLLITKVTPDFWYVDTQLHAAERLRFGVTAILTQPGLSHARLDDLAHIRETARAADDLGIRAAVIAGMPRSAPWVGTYGSIVDGQERLHEVTPEMVLANMEELIQGSQGRYSDRVRYWVGNFMIGNPTLVDEDHPVNPFASDLPLSYFLEQADRIGRLKEDHGVGYWAHAWGDAITHAYDDGFRELLGEGTVLSHCTRLDDRSIELLAETGTNVNHCPRARRLQMWHENCRVVEMLEAGVNVGLGSDGPQIDRNCDPFMDMQMVFKLQRRWFSDPQAMPPGTVLEMSTINGYRALGLEDVGGSIEVGKKADLVVVDMRKPHLWPLTMPVHQLVYYANGSDVEHVFVDGRQVVRDGKVTSIDVDALLDQADEQFDRLRNHPGSPIPRLIDPEATVWSRARVEGARL